MVRTKESRKEIAARVITVFSILVSFGFPGKFTEITGEAFQTVCEYGAFLLQILAMLLTGGDGILNIKLLDLKRKYWAIYLMVAVFFGMSVFVTISMSEELISCIRLSVTMFFALWLAQHYAIEELLKLICLAIGLFAASDALFWMISPDSAFTSENGTVNFAGILTAKNMAAEQASCALILLFVAFRAMRREKQPVTRGFIILFVLQIVLLALCNSVGSVFWVILTIGYLVARRENEEKPFRLPLGLAYIICNIGFLVFALTVLPMLSPILEMLGKDATLTGRTKLWRQIITAMSSNHTLTGYGFAMFWRTDSATALLHTAFQSDTFFGTQTTSAHNAIMELWQDVGIFGIGAYFLALLVSTSHADKLSRTQYEFCAGYFLWYMICGFTERTLWSPYRYSTLFTFLAMGIACNKPERLRKKGKKEIEQMRK